MIDSLKEKVEHLEREEILHALRECRWIMARAARKLGITERMIGYKIMKYKIRKEEEMDGGITPEMRLKDEKDAGFAPGTERRYREEAR